MSLERKITGTNIGLIISLILAAHAALAGVMIVYFLPVSPPFEFGDFLAIFIALILVSVPSAAAILFLKRARKLGAQRLQEYSETGHD